MTEERVPYVIAVHEPVDQRNHPVFRIFDRQIAFHRSFVTLTGSVTAALMLSQAVYWTSRTDNAAGWFYKSADEWEEETGMTRREQETARRKLREFSWWQEELRKANGVPTLHYRIDANGFQQSLESGFDKSANPRGFDKSAIPDSTNPPSPIIRNTEITNIDYAESTRVPPTGLVDDSANNTTTNNVATTAYRVYARNVGKLMPAIADSLDHLINQYGDSLVAEAIKEAVANNRRQGKPGINFIAVIAKRMHEEKNLADSRRVAVTPEILRAREDKPKQATVKSPMVAALQAKLKQEMENDLDE